MKKYIYLISPTKIKGGKFYKELQQVLKTNKVKFFQLRLKKVSNQNLLKISKKIKKIARKNKVKFLINNKPLIGYIIEKNANKNNFSVVKDFCGHGIGKDFHEAPSILHYGTKNQGLRLKEGMIFTIEPMLNAGTSEVKILNDGWTAVTKDKQLSAQFEHTIGVTKDDYEIFTLSPKNYHKPPY